MTDKTLSEMRAALRVDLYQVELDKLDLAIRNKEYADAMDAWKEGHEAILKLKRAHNAVYKHLGELKPKTPKADKLKPGGKIDNPPAKGKKARRAAEADVTEANSDEP